METESERKIGLDSMEELVVSFVEYSVASNGHV